MTDKAAEKAKRATKADERARDPVPKPAGKTPPEEPLDEESLERVMRDSPL
jgi:hypothetical protein